MHDRAGRQHWFRDDAVFVEGGGTFWQGVMFGIAAEKEAEQQAREAEPSIPEPGRVLPCMVSRFAEFHGGRAWVQDRPGGGAAFFVFLPGPRRTPEADLDRQGDCDHGAGSPGPQDSKSSTRIGDGP